MGEHAAPADAAPGDGGLSDGALRDVVLRDVVLRDAVPGDADTVAAVHVASWQAAYRHLLPAPLLEGLSVDDRARWWRRLLEAPRGDHVVVAAHDGTLRGFVHVGLGPPDAPGRGELVTLYVAPGQWGAGLGRRLHDTGLDRLVDEGCAEARVWMLSTNERARRFYVRQGWHRTEEVRIQQFGTATVVDHRLAIDLTVRRPG